MRSIKIVRGALLSSLVSQPMLTEQVVMVSTLPRRVVGSHVVSALYVIYLALGLESGMAYTVIT